MCLEEYKLRPSALMQNLTFVVLRSAQGRERATAPTLPHGLPREQISLFSLSLSFIKSSLLEKVPESQNGAFAHPPPIGHCSNIAGLSCRFLVPPQEWHDLVRSLSHTHTHNFTRSTGIHLFIIPLFGLVFKKPLYSCASDPDPRSA